MLVAVAGDDEGQWMCANPLRAADIIAELREQHRQRQVFHRAEKALTLQIKALCRRLCGGDLKEAGTVYKSMLNGGQHEFAAVALAATMPLLEARSIVEKSRKTVEKRMTVLASQLPVARWVDGVRGVGILSLAQIIGECGDLSNYSNPAKVWKRMGLAVNDDGSRQRRVAGSDAVAQGYSPSRRSIMWSIGDCIVKAGGEFREVYDERKAYEVERAEAAGLTVTPAARIPKSRASEHISEGHIHNRAKRYMEKRLLRDLWRAWRDDSTA